MAHVYLPISVTQAAVKAAKARGVSRVARSRKGFWPQYKRAGSPARLTDHWKSKREGFVARHMAQVKARKERLFKDGRPTNRHLALAVWAYSPQRKTLERWLRSEGYL